VILARIAPIGQRVPLSISILITGLSFYLLTMAPGLLWGDDAELQRIVVTGEARAIGQSSRASHLLWLALASGFVKVTGWLPLDEAGRANLISALSAGVALPVVYAAGKELASGVVARPRLAGLCAAISLGVSHTFWLLAVRPAVYTLQMALLALAVWSVLRWRRTGATGFLALAALSVAVTLLNHVMILASVFGLAALALTVPHSHRARLYAALGIAALLGAAVLTGAAWRGVPVVDLFTAVLAYRPHVPPWRDVLLVPIYLAYQFPLSLPLALAGLWWLWRTDRGLLVGVSALYLGNVLLMLFRHHPAMYVRDQFIFYLPSYLPVALLVGVGGAVLLDGGIPAIRGWHRALSLPAWIQMAAGRARRWRLLSLLVVVSAPIVVYPMVAGLVGTLAPRIAPARQLPGRDPVTFYLWPAKAGYTGARVFAEDAFRVLEPEALVVADWLPYQTLRYVQQVEGKGPEVLLAQINAGSQAQTRFLLQHAGSRPLYIADNSPPPYYEIAELERCFTVARRGVLFRLTPRADGGELCK
jgi:hypothetical protein